MEKQWNGIFRIIEADLFDKDGKSIWHVEDLKNIIHKTGAEYILQKTFNNSLSTGTSLFWFGMDNRPSLTYNDVDDNIIGEPSGSNGYQRFSVSTSGQFIAAPSSQANYELISPNLTFTCSQNSWGPVSNLFVSTAPVSNGYLISSVRLTQPISLSSGQSFVVRMGLSLFNC